MASLYRKHGSLGPFNLRTRPLLLAGLRRDLISVRISDGHILEVDCSHGTRSGFSRRTLSGVPAAACNVNFVYDVGVHVMIGNLSRDLWGSEAF